MILRYTIHWTIYHTLSVWEKVEKTLIHQVTHSAPRSPQNSVQLFRLRNFWEAEKTGPNFIGWWLPGFSLALFLYNKYLYIYIPWEPITFIFRGYNPYFEGLKLKPSFSHGFGVQGYLYIYIYAYICVCVQTWWPAALLASNQFRAKKQKNMNFLWKFFTRKGLSGW